MSEYISRTISAMLGKGNENHNSRKFIAHNVDPSRTSQNVEYKSIKIQSAYHILFDDALKRYNDKQTRSDRVIKNYYEKIRTSKQEKPFHEVIIQIGNKDDMNASSSEGKLAKAILDDYMKSFQKRNSSLHVFSAHLHMDEETPHLHIDFIPYITGSKRGLDTRVSLKQALAQLGFKGGSRNDTEWNQWIASEKQVLANIMEQYNVEWLQLGTHEKHLSVLNYEKKMRQEEINALSTSISQLSHQKETLNDDLEQVKNEINEIETKLYSLKEDEQEFYKISEEVNKDEIWKIPEPPTIMSAKQYYNKIIKPFIEELRKVVDVVITKYNKLYREVKQLRGNVYSLKRYIYPLEQEVIALRDENRNFRNQLSKLSKILGKKEMKQMLEEPIRKKVNIYDKER